MWAEAGAPHAEADQPEGSQDGGHVEVQGGGAVVLVQVVRLPHWRRAAAGGEGGLGLALDARAAAPWRRNGVTAKKNNNNYLGYLCTDILFCFVLFCIALHACACMICLPFDGISQHNLVGPPKCRVFSGKKSSRICTTSNFLIRAHF